MLEHHLRWRGRDAATISPLRSSKNSYLTAPSARQPSALYELYKRCLPLRSYLCTPGYRVLRNRNLDYICAMKLKEEAVRASMRVKVRDHHRIEKRRGLVVKVVGTYGGEEYTGVEVQFPGGQRRLFWPSDLEIVSSTKPWWLLLLTRDRKTYSQ
jgi:hypothetical protein